MYKTNLEIAELLKSWLNSEKIIKLPKVIVPIAGIGIMARESWTEDFEKCECYYEGKSNIPKSISIYSSGTPIALLVRNKTASDEKEVQPPLHGNPFAGERQAGSTCSASGAVGTVV